MPDLSPFGIKFVEAISFLRRRLSIPEAEWQQILDEAGGAADILAEGQRDAMARDLLEAVADALDNGATAQMFRKDYDAIVKKHGWSYHGDKGWHSDLIFRVQTSIATAAGRWEQIQRVKETRRWLRYVTVHDNRVRLTHREWHNVVLPVDHPFWKTHFPPNGFQCRCRVVSLSDRDLERWNYKPTPPDHPVLQVPPDKGWLGNVGIAGLRLSARK